MKRDIPRPKTLREIIVKAMNDHGVLGDPADFVVLMRWNCIIDTVKTWKVETQMPTRIPPGDVVWVLERSDRPDLIAVTVVDDRGETLWVERADGKVRFLIPRSEARATAIPYRPTLVHKRDLATYIGEANARMFWDDTIGCRVAYA